MKNTLLIVSDAEGITSIAGWKDAAKAVYDLVNRFDHGKVIGT